MRKAISLKKHWLALRTADLLFEAERDRRYSEVALEREKALKIKETADLAALQLAREIQTYKDEKANELREQISSERGLYATKDDLQSAVRELRAEITPLTNDASGARGRSIGHGEIVAWAVASVSVVAAIVAIVSVFLLRGGH